MKIFARKMRGLCPKMRGLSYHTEVSLEIPHDEVQKKNLDAFVFPLLTNMCYKTNVPPKI